MLNIIQNLALLFQRIQRFVKTGLGGKIETPSLSDIMIKK